MTREKVQRGQVRQAGIRLAVGAEDVGLAVMLADLIRQNLEQSPRRWADFSRLNSLIFLEARDAGVAITLAFARGELVIHGGIHGDPVIRISATAISLLALPLVRIVAGLPSLFGPAGRGLRRGLFSGEVRIRGMLRNPRQLILLTRLLSVSV